MAVIKNIRIVIKGLNSRLDEVQAAILSVKLKYLDDHNNRRIKIANYYDEYIRNKHVILPAKKYSSLFSHVYHLYVIKRKKEIT